MAVFAPVIANIKTAYDTYVTAAAAVVAAKATVTGLGARPSYPVEVVLATDWTNITTSQNTYDTNMAAALATLNTAQNTARTAELAVLTQMGYGSGATAPAGDSSNGIMSDQWVKLVGAGAGILTYTNYVGWASNSLYLVVLTQEPLNRFPDKTPVGS